MSITSAINSARSGLQVTSLRADTVATNVANATTPGYVRRSVSVSELLVGRQTNGVQANGITRSTNERISAERRDLSSDQARAGVLSSAWQNVSARLGDSLDGDGLFASVSNFETALSAAANTPESSTANAALLDAARGVVQQFNTLSRMIDSERSQADAEIATGVETVNQALKTVQSLNARIAGVDRTTASAAALFDERQRALDTLAEYLPIQSVERTSGTIDIVTREGVYLLAGTAREIEFSPSPAIGPGQSLSGGSLSGLTVDGVDLTPGASSFGAVSSGIFSALFQLRDDDLPNLQGQLDTVATDLVSRLSDDAIDPTKTPGENGLFVDPNPTAGPGVAGRLSLNPAVDPTQGGELFRLRDGLGAITEGPPANSTILNAMLSAITRIDTINQNGIQGQFSASELSAHLSSLSGQKRVGYDAVLSSATTQHNALIEAERAETGVDIDGQMQDLLLIEQAYAANARVIQVASDMLNRLMEL